MDGYFMVEASDQGRHIKPKKKFDIQKHAHQLLLLCHGLIKKIALSSM